MPLVPSYCYVAACLDIFDDEECRMGQPIKVKPTAAWLPYQRSGSEVVGAAFYNAFGIRAANRACRLLSQERTRRRTAQLQAEAEAATRKRHRASRPVIQIAVARVCS